MSNEILELREKLGLTQEELCSYLGVGHKTTICLWETGRRKPNEPLRRFICYLNSLSKKKAMEIIKRLKNYEQLKVGVCMKQRKKLSPKKYPMLDNVILKKYQLSEEEENERCERIAFKIVRFVEASRSRKSKEKNIFSENFENSIKL